MLTSRHFVLGVLPTTLLLSLICSGSIQYGHADAPIAESADDVQPLGVGDVAVA